MGNKGRNLLTVASSAFSWLYKKLGKKSGDGLVPARVEWGRIAIVISHEKNMWAVAVVQRFVASLREQMGYQRTPDIEILSAQGSHNNLVQMMREMHERHKVGKSYEVIVTVGDWCSREVRDILDTWQTPLPHIFCPAYDPVALGLVDSLQHTGRDITGVTSVLPDFKEQFNMLTSLHIKLENILVVYDPFDDDKVMGADIEGFRQQFIAAADEHDIKVHFLTMSSNCRLEKDLPDKLVGMDMVCTLPEQTVSAYLDILVDACNVAQIPLCTAELSSVYHGASFGFGERGSTYGPYAASIVYDMLVNSRPLCTIPVITLNHRPYMRFNNNALVAQGVSLTNQVKNLLSISSIFRDVS